MKKDKIITKEMYEKAKLIHKYTYYEIMNILQGKQSDLKLNNLSLINSKATDFIIAYNENTKEKTRQETVINVIPSKAPDEL